MSIIFSLFETTRATRPEQVVTDWPGFVDFLRACAEIERPSTAAHKLDCTPAISPAYYREGDTRGNARVLGWGGWTALDLDSGLDPSAVLDVIEPLNHVVYSSTSSSRQCPKFRVMIEADRPIGSSEAPAVWLALGDLIPALDRQCRDLSRLYYVPAAWQSSPENPAPYRIWSEQLGAGALPIDEMVALVDPARLPSPPSTAPLISALAGVEPHAGDLMRADILAEYLALPRGEHHVGLYRLMCRVASDAVFNGVAITAEDLVSAAREADSLCATKTNAARWGRIREEARRALSWAARSCETKPNAALGMFGR